MDNETSSTEKPQINETELKLYSILVKQFQGYQSLIWQIPTALLVANFFVLEKFYNKSIPLIALLFNFGLIFVFQRMIINQHLIMMSLRSAEKKIRDNFPDFIFPFKKKKRSNASLIFLFIMWALEIGLGLHITVNIFYELQ
jgi:hypothetical protein